MATAVAVTGKVEDSSGKGIGGVAILATPSQTVTTALSEPVFPFSTTSAPDGTYTLTLYKNSDLVPLNTTYSVNVGGRATLTIIVTGAGTIESMLVVGAMPAVIGINAGNVFLQVIPAASGPVVLDRSIYGAFKPTLAGNVTFSLVGAGSGQQNSADIWIYQAAASGPYTVTWPGSVVWPGGLAPTMPTTAGSLLYVNLTSLDAGVTWQGSYGPPKNSVSKAVSTGAAFHTSSDGVAWLSHSSFPVLTLTPLAPCTAVLSGRALGNTAVNTVAQDFGFYVVGGVYPTTINVPEVWTESSISQTGSDNKQCYIDTTLPLAANTTYTITFRHKLNASGSGGAAFYGMFGVAGPPVVEMSIIGQLIY